MVIKLSIKNNIPLRPIGEFLKVTMCEELQGLLLVSHAGGTEMGNKQR